MIKTLPEGYILYTDVGFTIEGIGSSSNGIFFNTLEDLKKALAEIYDDLFYNYRVGNTFQFELYNSKGEFVKPINIKLTSKHLNKIEAREKERDIIWNNI